jgi:glucokinase
MHKDFLIAIDFGGTKIAMATTTSNGERLQALEIPTQAADGATRVMQRMFDAAAGLIEATRRVHPGTLNAVSAVTPGIIEARGIKLAPNNPGWDTLALADVLKEGFGVPYIAVDTDVKAAALAEARSGALAGVECGLYVNLGTGLAAAAVINGRVLRGAHGAAGEVAYQLRGTPGEPCFADGAAPLEDFVSGRALSRNASALLGREISTRDTFALAETDARLAALIAETLHVLGVHLVNIALMLDPACVALGGGMARAPGIADAMDAIFRLSMPYPPEVRIARYGHDAALQGAILRGVEMIEAVN